MIEFVDDKKGKHMSHEARFTAERQDHKRYSDVEIIGYGATKEEALENLKSAINNVLSELSEVSGVDSGGNYDPN